MSKRTFTRVLRRLTEQPWAILPSSLETICAVVQARMDGIDLSADEKLAVQKMAAARQQPQQSDGAVGVLPLFGPIAARMNMFTEISGGTSMDAWMKDFRAMRDDPGVKSILLDVDSPGGEVALVPEAADEILASRGTKPIIALARPMMASAAYWLSAAADEIVVTPSGEVGSIGVVLMHADYSKQNEMAGVKPTYITYGDHKAEGNPDEPLTDETRQYLQEMVNAVGEQFVKFVAKARGVSVSTVKGEFGSGRMLRADRAVEVGAANRVGTYEKTLAQMVRQRVGGAKATVTVPAMAAEATTVTTTDTPAVAFTVPATTTAPVVDMTVQVEEPPVVDETVMAAEAEAIGIALTE